MDFKLLSNIDDQVVLDTHNKAFSDYEVPMELPLDFFQYINKRRNVNFDLSIGAFEDSNLVGFIINGIGDWNGIPTAYDCGTGVIPEFRRTGLGKTMINSLTSHLIEANISQYLLEVIKTNEKAFQLYLKNGFKVVREFDCVFADKDTLNEKLTNDSIPEGYRIDEITNPDWDQLQSFWDCPPSWQNSINSMKNVIELIKIYGIYDTNKNLLGYGILELPNGGIPQFAIKQEYRRKKLGTYLLAFMNKIATKSRGLNMINVDKNATSMLGFVHSFGFQTTVEQYEMIKSFE